MVTDSLKIFEFKLHKSTHSPNTGVNIRVAEIGAIVTNEIPKTHLEVSRGVLNAGVRSSTVSTLLFVHVALRHCTLYGALGATATICSV